MKNMRKIVAIEKNTFGFWSSLVSNNTTITISMMDSIEKAKKSSNFRFERILKIANPTIFMPKIQNPIVNKKSTKEIDENITCSIFL